VPHPREREHCPEGHRRERLDMPARFHCKPLTRPMRRQHQEQNILLGVDRQRDRTKRPCERLYGCVPACICVRLHNHWISTEPAGDDPRRSSCFALEYALTPEQPERDDGDLGCCFRSCRSNRKSEQETEDSCGPTKEVSVGHCHLGVTAAKRPT